MITHFTRTRVARCAALGLSAMLGLGLAGCAQQSATPVAEDREQGSEGPDSTRGGGAEDVGAAEGATAAPSASAAASSAFAITGDPQTDCEALIGGQSAAALAPKPDESITRYAPMESYEFISFGDGFEGVIGSSPVICRAGAPNSEWSITYGYSAIDAATREQLTSWVLSQPQGTAEEVDGRTVMSYLFEDEAHGDATIHVSASDSDAVFSFGDKPWEHFPDL